MRQVIVMKTAARLATVAKLLGVALGGASAQSISGGAFSLDDWLADYSYLKLQLERDYSHLAWFAVFKADEAETESRYSISEC